MRSPEEWAAAQAGWDVAWGYVQDHKMDLVIAVVWAGWLSHACWLLVSHGVCGERPLIAIRDSVLQYASREFLLERYSAHAVPAEYLRAGPLLNLVSTASGRIA